MSNQVLAAGIAAVASLVTAILAAFISYRTQKRVTALQDKLQESRAERDARRDYEYEAKKRLYAECEPVLFEALELAENARRRIVSLARTAKQGDIKQDGSGWLAVHGAVLQARRTSSISQAWQDILPKPNKDDFEALDWRERLTDGTAVLAEPPLLASHSYLARRLEYLAASRE